MTFPAISLQERLPKLGVDAILFNTSESLRSYNLARFSGFTGSDASILLTRAERHLFTDGRYKSQSKEQSPGYRIHVVKRKLDAIAATLRVSGVRRLGIEAPRMSFELVTALVKRAPGLEVVPLKRDFLEDLRIRKSREERDKIKAAAALASRACREVIDEGLIGKREVEVAARLESLFRHYGAEGPAFETIVASGTRSAFPHGIASDKVIGNGELVIVDYGCRQAAYNSDETVTCVTGPAAKDQRRVFQAVYEGHMRALEAVREGVAVRELDRIARAAIDKAGYGKYFLHGLGHGVGMEIHEPPYLSPRGRGVLLEGMVFTIEPGVYLEPVGGVRLESLVYLGKTGPEILSEMPKDLLRVN